MTTARLTHRLAEAVLAALSLPGDDATYELVYSAVQNADEAEGPDPRLQAVFIVEAVEAVLGIGLDEPAFDGALSAVTAILPTPAELEDRWQTGQIPGQPRALAPDAFLEMAFEDRVNGGLDID